MKGVVFNLLEQVITGELGDDAWDDVLDASGSDGAYTSVGTYEHEDFVRLVAAAAARLEQPVDDTVRWFGRRAVPLLAGRYPAFFEAHDATLPFLLTLNEVIHPEVRKLFPGAYAPEFDFRVSSPEVLELGYVSFRDMCAFAE